jgi:tRNA 2-selenouridine synthase
MSQPVPLLDVRSPAEFEQGHIPGAINVALFTNEERARVGTIYKQDGHHAAVLEGLRIVGPKMASIVEQALELAPDRSLKVHCWRGGMRSGSVGWLLRQAGFTVEVLHGGYKAYRQFVLNELAVPRNFIILGGPTGSGKTHVLKALQKIGEQVIDLEGLANHKGSAFGAIGQAVQPSQEMFENKLATALFNNKTNEPFWVEDESQRIGLVMIPTSFFIQMRNSVCHFIIIPFEERLNFIVQGYGGYDVQLLIDATVRIQKRLGGLDTRNAVQFLNENNIIAAFAILLKYYDRWYEKNTLSASPPKLLVQQFNAEKVDPINNAILVEKR